MLLSCIVVEDEAFARQELVYLLENTGLVDVLGEGCEGEDAIKLCTELKPDVVFLDIKMGEMNGLQAAEIISSIKDPPMIVFVTGYDEYALRAFEVHAIDYLLKPVDPQRLRTTIHRLFELKYNKRLLNNHDNQEKTKKIPVWQDNRLLLFDPKNIVYIEASGKNSLVNTTIKEQILARSSIGEMELKLQGLSFFKNHRSYMINLNYVKELKTWFNNSYLVVLEGYEHVDIPLSRTKVKEFKEMLGLL